MTSSAVLLFLKNLLFTVLIPGTVAVYVPLLIASDASPPPDFPWTIRRYAAIAPLMTGAALYFRCLWEFATFGRGTPAPIDAPKRLVIRGPYRYVRNPMYVGVLLVIAGWVVYFASATLLLYAAAVAAVVHLFIVFYEEPTLRSTFGADYERYTSEVNRWLPRLHHSQAASGGGDGI
ncbi:MAG: methyltransferase family protein [Candidatus Binatia bacterium]